MAKAKTTLTLYKARGDRKPCQFCGKLHDPKLDALAAGLTRAVTLLLVAHDAGDISTAFAHKALRAGLKGMLQAGVKLAKEL